MNIYIILGIIFTHWFADFVLQTDKQARRKSKNFNDLLDHTIQYSAVWLPVITFMQNYLGILNFQNVILFFLITLIAHTITDYFTSRLNSKLWEQGRVHDFFVSVGFDQVLHYLQLFLTFKLLIQ